MKTWWQVYIVGKPTFGFATIGTKIVDHTEWNWKGEQLSLYKQWLIQNKAKVVKICDVCTT